MLTITASRYARLPLQVFSSRHLSSSTLPTNPNPNALKPKLVVVGAGPTALSFVYHLLFPPVDATPSPSSSFKRLYNPEDIVIIERDPSYTYNSACLSAGGIRTQFSLKENIKLSLYGMKMLKHLDSLSEDTSKSSVSFVNSGYLMLSSATPSSDSPIHKNNQTQIEAGVVNSKLLGRDELKAQFPYLNLDGSEIQQGQYSRGAGDGYFDAYSFMNTLKRIVIESGVNFVKGEVVAGTTVKGSCTSVKVKLVNRKEDVVYSGFEKIAVCAGSSSAMTLNSLSEEELIHKLPIVARRRVVYSFSCDDPSLSTIYSNEEGPLPHPLTVTPSGMWYRSDGDGKFICGLSPPNNEVEDPDYDSSNLLNDPQRVEDILAIKQSDSDHFIENIWPALYKTVPAFGALKFQSGASWAGFYDYNTYDQNLLLGYHPDITNALVISGMSGHGLQQSAAAGHQCSLILRGEGEEGIERCWDLGRAKSGRGIYEQGIV